MTFNLAFPNAPFRADALREIVEASEGSLPAGAWPLRTLGNHDIARFGARWSRRRSPGLRAGAYETRPAPEGVWAWRRGEATTVVVNLTDEEQEAAGARLEPRGAAILTR
jgi:hypothetical protein